MGLAIGRLGALRIDEGAYVVMSIRALQGLPMEGCGSANRRQIGVIEATHPPEEAHEVGGRKERRAVICLAECATQCRGGVLLQSNMTATPQRLEEKCVLEMRRPSVSSMRIRGRVTGGGWTSGNGSIGSIGQLKKDLSEKVLIRCFLMPVLSEFHSVANYINNKFLFGDDTEILSLRG